MDNTNYQDVVNSFQSHPMSKYILADSLVKMWFDDALGEYELNIQELHYDDILNEFPIKLHQSVVKTIALLMYTNYLTRELSRAEKLNGIAGKDIQLTGSDGTKRVTLADLQLELNRANSMLDKQKTYKFD